MIGRFLNAMFDYGDQAKAEGNEEKYKIIQNIQDMIQIVYDEGTEFRSYVRDYKPKNKVEEIILSVPDLEVYHDKTDDSYYYEIDDRHFDTPEEVVKYIISTFGNRRREHYYRKKHRPKGVKEV